MITSEERRAIAERIDAIDWDASEGSWHFIGCLCRAMGMDDTNTYKNNVKAIAGKVRELCEASDDDAYQHVYDEGFASADDWYADRTDAELSSHGLMRLPKGADGVTVMPGQDVYGGDGGRWHVIGVGGGKYPIIAVPYGVRTNRGEYKRLKPSWLRHKRDTPRLLAEEIDRWVVSSERDEPLDELRSIARRLRALGGDGR
jgi:hypothetical protein